VVGSPGFEPGSREPKSRSLDHASRRPLLSNRTPCSVDEAIVKTLWQNRHLKSVKTWGKRLRRLAKATDLYDPIVTESYILSQDWANRYKNKLLDNQKFTQCNGIGWQKKRLKEEEYPIGIPTEQKIDLIISSCTKTYATIFRVSKHGLRPDEISKILLRDVDFEKGELTVRTSKLGAQRTLRIDEETIDLLREHVRKRGITGLDQRLFAKPKKIKQISITE